MTLLGENQKPIKINEELPISYMALERKSNHHVDVAENSDGHEKIILYLVADNARHTTLSSYIPRLENIIR